MRTLKIKSLQRLALIGLLAAWAWGTLAQNALASKIEISSQRTDLQGRLYQPLYQELAFDLDASLAIKIDPPTSPNLTYIELDRKIQVQGKKAHLKLRYAIVPKKAGSLVLPALTLSALPSNVLIHRGTEPLVFQTHAQTLDIQASDPNEVHTSKASFSRSLLTKDARGSTEQIDLWLQDVWAKSLPASLFQIQSKSNTYLSDRRLTQKIIDGKLWTHFQQILRTASNPSQEPTKSATFLTPSIRWVYQSPLGPQTLFSPGKVLKLPTESAPSWSLNTSSYQGLSASYLWLLIPVGILGTLGLLVGLTLYRLRRKQKQNATHQTLLYQVGPKVRKGLKEAISVQDTARITKLLQRGIAHPGESPIKALWRLAQEYPKYAQTLEDTALWLERVYQPNASPALNTPHQSLQNLPKALEQLEKDRLWQQRRDYTRRFLQSLFEVLSLNKLRSLFRGKRLSPPFDPLFKQRP